MSNPPYIPPEYEKSAFNCPLCQAYAEQKFGDAAFWSSGPSKRIYDVSFSVCSHCHKASIWVKGILVYPDSTEAPLPNPDLPDDIRRDYEEASRIVGDSPRGAAALLRLCVQKLCKHLGEPGKNINTNIASLVKKGLNPDIQKSLDVVRVIGNEAVHPGTMNLDDDQNTAIALFKLVNIITDAMISQKKMIDSLYTALPSEKRDQIESRDK